jgi:hypothetical protein
MACGQPPGRRARGRWLRQRTNAQYGTAEICTATAPGALQNVTVNSNPRRFLQRGDQAGGLHRGRTQSQTDATAAAGTTVTINDVASTNDQWNLALLEPSREA